MLLVESNFTNIITESSADKKLYLRGVFMESMRRNRNGREYDRNEIESQVAMVNRKLSEGRDILGELDHPPTLTVELKNVSHRIVEMHMEGNNAVGKAEILDTNVGRIARTLLEAGVKLGVSTRGSGTVSESSGKVSNFSLVTVDIVANPSAIEAYPKPVLEHLERYHRGEILNDLSEATFFDKSAQKYFLKEITKFIETLKV